MQKQSLSSRLDALKAAPSAAAGTQEPQDRIDMIRQLRARRTTHTNIGYLLVQTPLFLFSDLHLYCGVPARYLLAEDAPPWNEYFDFVVCQGQDAIAAVKLTSPDVSCRALLDKYQAAGIPEDFVQVFQSASFEGDEDWFVFDVATPILTRRLQSGGARLRAPFCPVSPELVRKLCPPALRVLDAEQLAGRKAWLPSDFGISLGLMQAFRTGGSNQVESLLCCREEDLKELHRTAAWGRQALSSQSGRPLSLSQRVDLANQGLSANPAAMEDVVRQFAVLPLEDYLRHDPEALQKLRSAFPGARTVQDAASRFRRGKDDPQLLEAFAGPIVKRKDLPLSEKTVSIVYLAASTLSRNRYIAWCAELFLHDFNRSGSAWKWPYRDWVRWVLGKLQEARRNGQTDTEWLEQMLYYLAVFPFCLLHHNSNQTCA